jgi:hypothetical protein
MNKSKRLDEVLTWLVIAHHKGMSAVDAAKKYNQPLVDVWNLWRQWDVK